MRIGTGGGQTERSESVEGSGGGYLILPVLHLNVVRPDALRDTTGFTICDLCKDGALVGVEDRSSLWLTPCGLAEAPCHMINRGLGIITATCFVGPIVHAILYKPCRIGPHGVAGCPRYATRPSKGL